MSIETYEEVHQKSTVVGTFGARLPHFGEVLVEESSSDLLLYHF